jgi:catechol 2,3-dioxygenase-like lactoylglutathione lyase family enzyme
MTVNGALHHVEIYVRNLAATRQFYDWLLVDHLGYHVYQEWASGISYILDEGTYIVFVQSEKLAAPYNRTNVGLNHLAFNMIGQAAVDRLRTELDTLAYHELYAARYPFAGGPDHYALYLEDPDRIKIEIVAVGN